MMPVQHHSTYSTRSHNVIQTNSVIPKRWSLVPHMKCSTVLESYPVGSERPLVNELMGAIMLLTQPYRIV